MKLLLIPVLSTMMTFKKKDWMAKKTTSLITANFYQRVPRDVANGRLAKLKWERRSRNDQKVTNRTPRKNPKDRN